MRCHWTGFSDQELSSTFATWSRAMLRKASRNAGESFGIGRPMGIAVTNEQVKVCPFFENLHIRASGNCLAQNRGGEIPPLIRLAPVSKITRHRKKRFLRRKQVPKLDCSGRVDDLDRRFLLNPMARLRSPWVTSQSLIRMSFRLGMHSLISLL